MRGGLITQLQKFIQKASKVPGKCKNSNEHNHNWEKAHESVFQFECIYFGEQMST